MQLPKNFRRRSPGGAGPGPRRVGRPLVALVCAALVWAALAWVGLVSSGAVPASAGPIGTTLPPAKILPCFGTKCPTTHIINFDSGAVGLGQQVTDQYEGDGVYFADPSENGFQSGEPQPGQDLVSTLA